MIDELLLEVVRELPTFAGLVILAGALWKINERQWSVIERVLENCEKLEARMTELAQSVKALSKP